MASLAIFCEVSLMPSPIRAALLLNSDLAEAGDASPGAPARASGGLAAAGAPPIFWRVSVRERNSDVRSL